jgi:galactokinase
MIADLFKDVFKIAPTQTCFSPGRVNLIGEHTDYNGGQVLPTALSLGLEIAMCPRPDNKINIISDKFGSVAQRSLASKYKDHWSDYVAGAVIAANTNSLLPGGADIAISSTLPFGAGLSSSAAVIVGILKLARESAGSEISDEKIARIARQVENDFIGMPCGIMDQMAIAVAQPGQAMALDTKSLKYDLIDLPADYHMAVIHSGHFRQLSEGRYKERKEECDLVKETLGHEDICLISDHELEALQNQLAAQIYRRARHCVTEHRRTIAAAKALKSHDMQMFGNLMIDSHASLRDDFEISIPPVDALVDDAVKFGALGARQTGGGFGGCIVACIAQDKYEDWLARLLPEHPGSFSVC